MKEVCIVGAGVSGLLAVKECLEQGLQSTCYEQHDDIGKGKYKQTTVAFRPPDLNMFIDRYHYFISYGLLYHNNIDKGKCSAFGNG